MVKTIHKNDSYKNLYYSLSLEKLITNFKEIISSQSQSSIINIDAIYNNLASKLNPILEDICKAIIVTNYYNTSSLGSKAFRSAVKKDFKKYLIILSEAFTNNLNKVNSSNRNMEDGSTKIYSALYNKFHAIFESVCKKHQFSKLTNNLVSKDDIMSKQDLPLSTRLYALSHLAPEYTSEMLMAFGFAADVFISVYDSIKENDISVEYTIITMALFGILGFAVQKSINDITNMYIDQFIKEQEKNKFFDLNKKSVWVHKLIKDGSIVGVSIEKTNLPGNNQNNIEESVHTRIYKDQHTIAKLERYKSQQQEDVSASFTKNEQGYYYTNQFIETKPLISNKQNSRF